MLAKRIANLRTFSVLGSVTASGGLKIPDIQGEVRMNDQIKPGIFASGVVAGWVDSSAVLKKEYGRTLDIFQICDGDKEKSAAAVLTSAIYLPGRSTPVQCVTVLQHGAVDTFIDYLQFRASEAQNVALRYAKDTVSDHGLILTVHHEKNPQLDEDERIIAEVQKLKFSFLRPKTSEDQVHRVQTGPDMQGLFRDFTNFPLFQEWETQVEESPGRSMWVVKSAEGTVLAGVSRVAKHGNEVVLVSPFLTDHAADLAEAARAVETLVSHIACEENCKSAILMFDAKDPFKSFASRYLGKSKVESAEISVGAIPAGLGRAAEEALLRTPLQVAAEMLDWKIYNRL